jgi:hypothetical protein
MPYKDPEHKLQWEREHRKQRNERRRTQRLSPGSGQATAQRKAFDFAAALRSARKPVSKNQKPKTTWKAILGWVVGIGVVLLVAFTGARGFDTGATGSGK